MAHQCKYLIHTPNAFAGKMFVILSHRRIFDELNRNVSKLLKVPRITDSCALLKIKYTYGITNIITFPMPIAIDFDAIRSYSCRILNQGYLS